MRHFQGLKRKEVECALYHFITDNLMQLEGLYRAWAERQKQLNEQAAVEGRKLPEDLTDEEKKEYWQHTYARMQLFSILRPYMKLVKWIHNDNDNVIKLLDLHEEAYKQMDKKFMNPDHNPDLQVCGCKF